MIVPVRTELDINVASRVKAAINAAQSYLPSDLPSRGLQQTEPADARF